MRSHPQGTPPHRAVANSLQGHRVPSPALSPPSCHQCPSCPRAPELLCFPMPLCLPCPGGSVLSHSLCSHPCALQPLCYHAHHVLVSPGHHVPMSPSPIPSYLSTPSSHPHVPQPHVISLRPFSSCPHVLQSPCCCVPMSHYPYTIAYLCSTTPTPSCSPTPCHCATASRTPLVQAETA